MLIQCTKSLQDRLGLKEKDLVSNTGTVEFPASLHSWHANFVTMDRRKAIILMNDETRFPVVIYRPTSTDVKNIKNIIVEAMKEALRVEGIKNDIIDTYIGTADSISFSKTANRSMVAKLNNSVRDIEVMQEYLNNETTIQSYISILGARFIQRGEEGRDYFKPIERVLECFAKVYDQHENPAEENMLDVTLYQLKVSINIEGFDIWRRVLVPTTYSFRHLHHLIQLIFDWQNYHLHEFTVEKGNGKPTKIVMDDDPELIEYLAEDDFIIQQERFVALEDVFSETDQVTYEYDFGDSWIHHIVLEDKVNANEFSPAFIDGHGERPPEDVGGEIGYEEYMAIISNEQHPDYQFMKTWSENQKERTFSKEESNKRLKGAISARYFYW